MSDTLWHTKSGDEVITEFDTPLGGLSSKEAENRLERYGENKLREPEKHRELSGIKKIDLHPLFRRRKGKVEAWEAVSPGSENPLSA